jgi:glycerol-3-phosphate dehydrogenase
MVEREERVAPSRTAEIPLGMAARAEDLRIPEGLEEQDLPTGALDQLAFRYGHAARAVLELAAERPELTRPIAPDRPDLLAEAVVAVRSEQARSVADVLLRRTRLGILAAPALRDATSVLPVAQAIGSELGWRGRRARKEAEAWVDAARTDGVDPAADVS